MVKFSKVLEVPQNLTLERQAEMTQSKGKLQQIPNTAISNQSKAASQKSIPWTPPPPPFDPLTCGSQRPSTLQSGRHTAKINNRELAALEHGTHPLGYPEAWARSSWATQLHWAPTFTWHVLAPRNSILAAVCRCKPVRQ